MNNYHKYLAVTPTEEDWGFYITTAGCSNVAPRQRYPPGNHPLTHSFTWNKGRILDGFYIVYISKGEGVFESVPVGVQPVTAGTIFILFPGIWHRYKPSASSGWEEYWVGFKGSYAGDLMSRHFFSPGKPFIHAGFHEELLTLFHELLDKVQHAQIGYHRVIPGICLQMLGLIYVIAMHRQQPENPDEQLISKAKFMLRESLEQQVNMQKLAQELPMGYSKFRKEFKRATGQSPHAYHLALRLDKACELLRSTALTVSEISCHTGFESPFYFSKIFRKKNGMSPTDYREQHLLKDPA